MSAASDSGVIQRPFRRLEAEFGGRSPAAGVSALTDPGPLLDPLVRRVHEEGHAFIGDDALGHEHARAANHGPGRSHEAGIIEVRLRDRTRARQEET